MKELMEIEYNDHVVVVSNVHVETDKIPYEYGSTKGFSDERNVYFTVESCEPYDVSFISGLSLDAQFHGLIINRLDNFLYDRSR